MFHEIFVRALTVINIDQGIPAPGLGDIALMMENLNNAFSADELSTAAEFLSELDEETFEEFCYGDQDMVEELLGFDPRYLIASAVANEIFDGCC